MSAEIADAAPLSLAEAKAYLRLETNDEDALVAGLIRTATTLCEAFTGRLLVRRQASETIAADGGWRRLSTVDVVQIDGVEALADDGAATALTADRWNARIEANGELWLRIDAPDVRRVRVIVTAGLAADWNGVPEPLRQGIARLVAHLHACRDAPDDAGPPAAVAALWRPWRRMRLG